MARTTINSQGVPAGTITAADLTFPLTDFSSTGIDDNATSNALTIDSSGNIAVTGTVDGRDLATDGTKLDGIAASATNYGDSDVATYISGNRSYGNITTTGYIAGPSTFTIDPAAVGDNTGTLVIAGNLQVDGTTTTINSTTMTVDDLNITLASGAANAAAANGAGITVDGASATLTYNGTNDDWNFNKNLAVAGNVTIDSAIYRTDTGAGGIRFATAGNIRPVNNAGTSTDLALDIGDPSFRFNDLHLGGDAFVDGAITSSGLTATLTSGYLRIQDLNSAVVSTTNMGGIEWRTGDSNVSGANRITASISAIGDGTFNAADKAPTALTFATHGTSGVSPTEHMRIDSSGNVGIGTTSPDNKFHVVSGSAGEVAQFTGEIEARGLSIRSQTNTDASAHVVFNSQSGGSKGMFTFETDGTERMRINSDGSIALSPNAGTVGQAALSINASGSSYAELDAFMWGVGWNMPLVLQRQAGNVGIGTISPSERLHVSGNIRAGVSATSFQNGSANDNYIGVGSDNGGDAWFIAHASGYGVGFMGYEAAGDRLLIGCDNGSGNNKIDFSLNMGTSAAGTVENTTSATPAVRINASGNVLVGTTNTSGSLSNTASTTSGSFKTQSGSVTQTGGSGWYSAFTIPNSQTGLYLLHVYVNGYVAGPSDWSNAFIISHTGAGNTAYLWNLSGANTGNIQARITSVASVEFYLIGGTNINYGYSLTRLH